MKKQQNIKDNCFEPLKRLEAEKSLKADVLKRQSQSVIKRFCSQRKAVIGLFVIVVLILLAIFVPIFSPYRLDEQNQWQRNLGISWQHWFGTDKFGRDLFVRIWMGVRISLFVGFLSALISMVIGTIYGGIAGYFGGIIDAVLMRIAEIVYSIPSMIYMILFMLVFDASLWSMILGICFSSWVGLARVMRNETMRLKNNEYVLASKVLGSNIGTIFFQDILKNAIGPLMVQVTLLVPQAIFMEAFLSFLGIGLVAPQASLGTMIEEARSQMISHPAQMIMPILFICMIVLAVNSVGDGLQYAYNPKQTYKERYESI